MVKQRRVYVAYIMNTYTYKYHKLNIFINFMVYEHISIYIIHTYIHACMHAYTQTCIRTNIHYISLHYITLPYIKLYSLYCNTLHYITIHYITLHYIHTLHRSYIILSLLCSLVCFIPPANGGRFSWYRGTWNGSVTEPTKVTSLPARSNKHRDLTDVLL